MGPGLHLDVQSNKANSLQLKWLRSKKGKNIAEKKEQK